MSKEIKANFVDHISMPSGMLQRQRTILRKLLAGKYLDAMWIPGKISASVISWSVLQR